MLLLGFSDYRTPAQRLAAALQLNYHEVELHRFPDGESKVTLPLAAGAMTGQHVVLCRSLDQPNSKLIELMLAVATLRQQSTARISLVAPYLCYMRQDIAFHAGEAVSQRIVGQFLAGLFDDVITVDPHLHRITALSEAIPTSRACALSATGLLGQCIAERWSQPLLLGPDSESEQWVSAIATRHGLDWGVARKQRFGDRDVRIELPALDYQQRQIVLVDDMSSTGRTLAQAAQALTKYQPAGIAAVLTHALFVDDALSVLAQAGVSEVLSSDSIVHSSNAVQLAPLLAEQLRKI